MSEPEMRAGMAIRDITPEPGGPMAGYSARIGDSAGIADPLTIRALSVHNTGQGSRLVFLVADLIAFDHETLREFRARVASEAGVDPSEVIPSVTHTHSGPAYGSFYSSYTRPAGEPEPAASSAWARQLPGVMIDVVREAVANEAPAALALAGGEAGISVHRRLKDPLGEVRLAANPTGPTDPAVSVLQARDPESGNVIATLVNHACHPVVLCEDNLRYSADFAGFMTARITEQTGAPALFLNSTCGDINPRKRGDFTAAQELGEELAAAALKALDGAQASASLPLATAMKTVQLPLRHTDANVFENYQAAATEAEARHANSDNFEGRRLSQEVERADGMLKRFRKTRQRIEEIIDSDGALPFTLQVARIGDSVVVAMPGETFSGFGRQLRERFAPHPVFVLGYSNEAIGYVPDRAAYPERGYEADVAHVAPGAGEDLTQAAIRLVGGLRASDGGT